MASEVVEASGHLIDSGILNGIFDTVIRHDATFEVLRFTIGRTNAEPSLLSMRVTASTDEDLRRVVENLVPLGCLIKSRQDAITRAADQDGCAPIDFYSTTNHETHVRRVGGLSQAVEQGIVKSGILYECQRHGIAYVLAGSIRDDGPLPDTIMDLIEAQDRYASRLKGVSLVLVLASMLHGIGVGNMLPSAVRVVCIDINPAVVTKLGDRGSSQTVGIVTDAGLFLRQLVEQLSA